MRRKTMSRRGFTLTETLMVIFILALMTAAGAVGVSAVLATRVDMIQTADAQILGSTAFQAIANELRFGRDVQVIGADGKPVGINSSGAYVALDSTNYGTEIKLFQSGGKLIYGDDISNPDQNNQILSEKAYSGLKIASLGFQPKADGSIEITMAVTGRKGTQLWNGTLSVVPLNG